MKGRTLSIMLAIWMVSVAFVGLAANVRAGDKYINNTTRIYINPNNYPDPMGVIPDYWYQPGDTITGYLQGWTVGTDTLEDVFDVVVGDDDPLTPGCDAVVFANKRLWADNIAFDPDRGSFTLVGAVANPTQFLSDGAYCAWVGPGDYLEQAGAVAHYAGAGRSARFEIHLYRIDVSTDKPGYIPGDTVRVSYTVSKIKDGSLVTDSDITVSERRWVVDSSDDKTDVAGLLSGATGTFPFIIANTGGVNNADTYRLFIWYNGSSGGAGRAATANGPPLGPGYIDIRVGNLGVRVDRPMSPSTQAPDTLLDVEITAFAETDTFVFISTYPNADVTISVLNGAAATSPIMPGYGGNFRSDAVGKVMYEFVLDSANFLAGKTYRLNTTASSILMQGTAYATFDIKTVPPTMPVIMQFDKASYFSSEAAAVTVTAQPPSGHSQPSTYVYTVSYGTTIFYRNVSTSSTLTYQIPANFGGSLIFRVDAYNAEGDYGFDQQSKVVVFGRMIVNAPSLYNQGDQLTVSFELKSAVMTGATTSFFFTVTDGARIVKQGAVNATPLGSLTGTLTYTVPNVPATTYTFTVYASGSGHVVWGQAAATLIQNFILSISFDKESYLPGDVMAVGYNIAPRVPGTPLPRIFVLTYGLLGYPSVTFRTTEAAGTVSYTVPAGANEGDVLFQMTESSTGAGAIEVVLIGAAPTKPAEIAGIEIFDAFLLVLIVILFLLMLVMRARGTTAAAPKPREEKAAPPPPPGPTASPMIVNCKACGAPIEITTSKRPIEVMCPSCGETAMVQ